MSASWFVPANTVALYAHSVPNKRPDYTWHLGQKIERLLKDPELIFEEAIRIC